jgi:hypothetical protein
MVVSAVETTEGLFQNWSRGRAIDPVAPLPSQIALVRRDWIGPMTFSPRAVSRMGLNGEPLSWTIDAKGQWSSDPGLAGRVAGPHTLSPGPHTLGES